ncbi:hypothetical protein GFB49_13960 [Epibacterium sp. SM1979]|uniref:VPLPA-CTERM protein sorting domain-containing protein n=1 Tax=Tritonibacter litoralis TaxID=2662264 RepID=A0A843YK73_9RHOB|nr:VPLPA-CTERM sorting domain-containing protein [Tritonibacter litoralis]MQQ09569.1 hypothetical protein [Tritonibacter litoralis]
MRRVRFQTALAQIAFCSAVFAAPCALAATLSLDAVDQGWYRDDGRHITDNQNTLTGRLSNGQEYRSWYAFDLSSDPQDDDDQPEALSQSDAGRITGATVVFTGSNGLAGSDDQSETLQLYDVTTDADVLSSGRAGRDGFADLGTGETYGSAEYATPGRALRRTEELRLTLNEAALADLNAALETGEFEFLIGAVLSTLSNENRSEFLWAFSRIAPAARLDLEVAPIPLPAGLPLLAGALGGLWLLRRRQTKTA